MGNSVLPRNQGAHFLVDDQVPGRYNHYFKSGQFYELKIEIFGLNHIQHKISERQNTIMTYSKKLGLWPDYGRRPMERSGSKLGPLGIFTISMKFLIEEVPSCPILEIWDFGRIEEQATGATCHDIQAQKYPHVETFQTSPHMLNLNNGNSSYT